MTAVTLQAIHALEDAIARSGQGIELPVTHYFTPGIYAREIRIPAGTVLTGRTHLQTQLNILSQGEISVWIDGQIRRIRAPATIVSPAGIKRVAFAHTDCVWTTLHGTHLTDLAQIEAEFVAPEVRSVQNSVDPLVDLFVGLSVNKEVS